MAALSSRIRSVSFGAAGDGIAFWCPGCEKAHMVRTSGPGSEYCRAQWTWDGNVDEPTLTPSILIRVNWSQAVERGDDPEHWRDEICHSFVRAGTIQFLDDCTHALRGRTVVLPDWPAPDG